MSKILIIYYSRTGNTQKMAEIVARGAQAKGAEVTLKEVGEVQPREMLDFDGIVMGSPTYYGAMAFEIKKLLDESVDFHSELEGKVGGAFASAANIGGGNETTVLSILNAMLIHGMIVPGAFLGDHYGPVSIGEPNNHVEGQCKALGQRVAALADKLCAKA